MKHGELKCIECQSLLLEPVRDVAHAHSRHAGGQRSRGFLLHSGIRRECSRLCRVAVKAGLWTLDWTMDWTVDWTVDWILDRILDRNLDRNLDQALDS